MKQITKLITIISLIGFISSCSESCPDSGTKTNYVDRGYLTDIIPYSDTSTRMFLKNGKDTLLFKSLGLKETFISGSSLSGDCPYHYENQQYTLRMAASDSDFFQINYYAIINGVPRVKININNTIATKEYANSNFRYFYPPIVSINILNFKYDTVMRLPEQIIEEFYMKPKYGILKIKTAKVTYELIK